MFSLSEPLAIHHLSGQHAKAVQGDCVCYMTLEEACGVLAYRNEMMNRIENPKETDNLENCNLKGDQNPMHRYALRSRTKMTK